MPLPSTPPIKLSEVYAEFVVPDGTPMSALLKGGAYVSDEVEAAIPEELPIRLLNFVGAVRPAEVSISGLAAVGGSLSGTTINDMVAVTTFTHPSGSGNETAEASGSVEITFLVSRATTPKLRLTARASNATVQAGVYRSPFGAKTYPAFDNGVNTISNSTVRATDNTGERQGTWAIESPVEEIGSSELQRISQALVLSNAAEDGQSFTVSAGIEHEISAFVAGSLGFGDVFSHNISGGKAELRLSLLFLDETGDVIVQEIPLSVTINTAGLLQATAVNFL